jgi:subtilisin-like proprotein convertase family protein
LPRPPLQTIRSGSTLPQGILPAPSAATNRVRLNAAPANTNKFAWRLSNTSRTIGQLANDRHAVLLENALIDTGNPLNFSIPKNLRAGGDPGAYIVQARGPVDNAFRAMLKAAGAEIVSYIPNNAYLVRLAAGGANGLAANPLAQAVIPYEPYYKVQSSLLALAVEQKPLPDDAMLNLGLFANGTQTTIRQIEQLGGRVLAQDRSPFGPVVRVVPPKNWTALTRLPGVQIVEPYHPRIHANDLSRMTVAVAADTQAPTNYLGLTGKSVLVAVADSGIDAAHPDFGTGGSPPSRVIGDPWNLVDYDGHGTHVAGIIAGDGTESDTVTNAPGSIIGTNGTAVVGQFRGKAPLATLLAMNWGASDGELQETAALTNALISNNSWDYGNGDATYDLAAASYDAAVRDALPEVTGSQPVLFVFSAGNSGGGNDEGGGGNPDTILSPGTAKNVITVGAIEQYRYITNVVTNVDGTVGTPWQGETDTGYQVPRFSSRGNVGIGIEGNFGRYKPDVVAPGTFVISTRSEQWDEAAYYNPTNYYYTEYDYQVVDTNTLNYYDIFVPGNAVGVVIQIVPNLLSPSPFPTNLPIYVEKADLPTTTIYDFLTTDNRVSIPPDNGVNITGIQDIQNGGFWYAVGNNTNFPINYNITTEIITTNDLGNYFEVLSNLNQSIGTFNSANTEPGPYYRYETGTSMSAADVSGVLALMEEFVTNTFALTPSPALLKAMLVNGARPTGNYDFQVQNVINLQGWGLINLTNSLPPGITNRIGPGCSSFFLDQSPTNALATGDRHTFKLQVSDPGAETLSLRITLAWTDPPGNPAAAIKLVNDLGLIVTNLDSGSVYYGNDIPARSTFNTAQNATNTPNLDFINNVENVYLPPLAGTNFAVTVVGCRVNVNAVTAHTNDVVQDYALVISSGNGEVTNAFTVTDLGAVSNPTTDQQITFVTTTNQPLLNQFVGANTPLLGTNAFLLTNAVVVSDETNRQIIIGMTNQWHFYVVVNTGTNQYFTNAAFITFLPATFSVPRMGVYADTVDNATRPEADIDLYVCTDSALTNLDPVVVSNCANNVGDYRSSQGRGGTEFVAYTDSTPGEIYYVGVKSEDQMASEFDFIPIFTDIPFSQSGPNGSQIVNGLNVPADIPDGSPARPGWKVVFAVAINPMEMKRVIVTNTIAHQNFGDLVGTLKHGGQNGVSKTDVLNNHDSIYNPSGVYGNIYDDSGQNDILGSVRSDGPGSLNNFVGQEGMGVWMLNEADDSLTQTGSVTGFTLLIEPHHPLNKGVNINNLPAQGWFYDYIDVPPGATNLTVLVTNETLPPGPIDLFVRFDALPTTNIFDKKAEITNLTQLPFPNGSITIDPFDIPPVQPGRYWIGVYNPGTETQTNIWLFADYILGGAGPTPAEFTSGGSVPIVDDAVTTNIIVITNAGPIVSVNVGVVIDHPRVSDLALTLVSPTGQRFLLFENRGGLTATNLGHINVTTNFFGTRRPGGFLADTNILGPVTNSGVLIIDYNFYQIPDTLDVYYDGVDIFSSGPVSYTGTFTIPYGPGASTNIMIIMNQGNNTNTLTGWYYTPTVVNEDYAYLTFTEDPSLSQVPIKFAVPPYDLSDRPNNYMLSDFESATNGEYFAPTNIPDANGGWTLYTNRLVGTNLVSMTNNPVSVVTDLANAQRGSNFLALANGMISRVVPTTPGRKYIVNYWYRGPGIAGWWRGEGNATDSADPEVRGNNGTLLGRFTFPEGEVGQAFQLESTNGYVQQYPLHAYVQVPQPSSLDVGRAGGLTIECWIYPTNLSAPEPLVEWLARVPTNVMSTNVADTNLVIKAGPFLNDATGHYYYLLDATNWTTSETWATQLGGHLATIDTANEENWVYDTFAQFGGTNRHLWIGLTNNALGTFAWASGLTNVLYTNWLSGQPINCSGNDHYVAIENVIPTNAPPGLWILEDNKGLTCGAPPTNRIFGVVEVEDIQTNGLQLWISVTNDLVGSNGCLYADLVDVSNVSHVFFSAPGIVQTNVYQHIALTYSTNTGVATLYYNGTNVMATNLGVFVPKTDGDVLLGRDMSRLTNNFFAGRMDEVSIYRRFLSDAEIAAIYQISALSTNRSIGKFDPSVTPALGLAEAQVSLGETTNVIFAANTNWQMQGFTFIATTSSVPFQITGIEPGMLLDTFSVSETPLGNVYYLPEESLQALVGQSGNGKWTLEIWDSRAGNTGTAAQLVTWRLQFIFQTNTPVPIPLSGGFPATNTIPPGQIGYFAVDVPSWAVSATNILVSSSPGPVDLLFNQTNLPGSGVGDYTFVPNNTSGSYTMSTNALPLPPLLPGQRYYLGVRNSGSSAATVAVEVDFDMTTLSNSIPVSGVLNTNDLERYFAYDVSTNACEATFQLLRLNGNADLVVRKGLPLPTLVSADYGSFNGGNVDENIYVLTNSSPVPLSAGRWYLGVIKRDVGRVTYAVLAKELDTNAPYVATIIDLTNNVPFTWTTGPGAALTNFFRFTVTNTITSTVTNLVKTLRFELYDMSGNGDLTVATNAPPLAPPFFQSGQEPGRTPELIYIHTNSALTNLAADWYLGVPNHEITNISFTILAMIDTNLAFPAFPTAEGAGAGALGGRGGDVYHVINLNDSGAGSLRYGIDTFFGTGATNTPGTGTTNLPDGSITNLSGARTIVFDVSGTITNLSALIITNSYLTIAGQTAPGSITVVGDMTTVQSAHDVVIRDIRFRPGKGVAGDSLQFTNVSSVIADHISASWSTNDLVSVLDSTNVTVQWSIMADSLYDTNNPHGFGSLLRYGYGTLTFHHNLYADNYNGSPRLGDNLSLDFVNNVIYNWGIQPGFSSTNDDMLVNTNGFTNQLNYVCNYLIAGADTAGFATNLSITNIAFVVETNSTWIFQTNNFIDSDTNGILNGANTDWGMFTNHYTPFDRPFPLPPVSVDEAFIAYEKVLDFAGVSVFARDFADVNIVTGVRNQSSTLISTPPLSGMVGWWPGDGNANDIVAGNNGVTQNIGYTNGVVGQAFACDPENYPYGTYTGVQIPDSPAYVLTNALTIEGWIRPRGDGYIIFWRGDNRPGLDPYVLSMQGNHDLLFYIEDELGNYDSVGTNLDYNVWYHVAATWDGDTGIMKLYVNGQLADQKVTLLRPFGVLNAGESPGVGIGNLNDGGNNFPFQGDIDEISLYNRALSAAEVQSIYNAGSAGKYASSFHPPLPLDTDQDGIPDYWEITFGQNPTNASNNQLSTNANYIGYTDLEEYNSWLAGPHALTVTNRPVGVDLYRLAGNSGQLSFFVTNAVNGSVYLTNVLGSVTNTGPFSNSIAVFMPATNYSGYASFGFVVTNNDTVAYFGPVPVSVMVSAVEITNAPVPPVFIYPANTTVLEIIETVPFTTNCVALDTNVPPNPLTFALVSGPAGLTVSTNGVIDWTPTEAQGPGTNAVSISVTATNLFPVGPRSFSVTNTFTIIVDESNLPPELPVMPDQIAYALVPMVVDNSATDPDIPANTLTYALLVAPTNAVIDANSGIITWTPDSSDIGSTNLFTTVVTDDGVPPLSATNSFMVTVVPAPPIIAGIQAFPGAEGAGTYAIGGRYGDVYHVVNLRDDGPGSLRFGLRGQNPRTIVFDVSGTITNRSPLKIRHPYLTIAGQTAPGDGITLKGWLTSVQNAHDVVVRFVRFRMGDSNCPVNQDDSFHFDYVTNSIADHVSASWSIDEVLSTTDSTNITVQWSVIAEGLNDSCHLKGLHGYGSLLRYGAGALSFHHNLYADNYSRNPRPGDNITLDFVNNVIYNWGIKAGYNEDDSADNPAGFTNYLNYVGNYFIAGPSTVDNFNIAFESGVPDASNTQIYQTNNLIDSNVNGVLDGDDTGWGMFSGLYTPFASPVSLPGTNITAFGAPEAYERVLDFVGAWQNRDTVDSNIVTGVRTQTGSIINSQGDVGGWPVLNSGPLPPDTDQDGMPDYWEITLGWNPTNAADGGLTNSFGYTHLEDYLNWLAAPHALLLHDTSVDVDLFVLAGRTGNQAFSVANGTNGTVTLGGDGHTATFTPTNGYTGFASFSFNVTNLDTGVGFGPVTVSVLVSAVNIYATVVTPLAGGQPQTNSIGAGDIAYYSVTVPTNADFATNILLFASGPLNLLFNQTNPPTGTNAGDFALLSSSTGGVGDPVLGLGTTPPLLPGATYYLGVQNTNSFTVSYGIEVDFQLPPSPPSISITSITYTNISGTNGFLLIWFAPSNDLFQVQWTPSLTPASWTTFTNIVSYDTNAFTSPTNTQFDFFDDGSQTGGFGTNRFYRLVLLAAPTNTPPVLPSPATRAINPLATLVVTNTATDADLPPQTLTYTLSSSVTGTNVPAIDTNGIITWTPTLGQADTTNTITTVVTDDGAPPLSATNSFVVIVNPVPLISGVTVATNGVNLQWLAPTNDQFQVQWTTNLVPVVVWNLFTNPPFITSTNGVFTFLDDGSQNGGIGGMMFYRLILLP